MEMASASLPIRVCACPKRDCKIAEQPPGKKVAPSCTSVLTLGCSCEDQGRRYRPHVFFNQFRSPSFHSTPHRFIVAWHLTEEPDPADAPEMVEVVGAIASPDDTRLFTVAVATREALLVAQRIAEALDAFCAPGPAVASMEG